MQKQENQRVKQSFPRNASKIQKKKEFARRHYRPPLTRKHPSISIIDDVKKQMTFYSSMQNAVVTVHEENKSRFLENTKIRRRINMSRDIYLPMIDLSSDNKKKHFRGAPKTEL